MPPAVWSRRKRGSCCSSRRDGTIRWLAKLPAAPLAAPLAVRICPCFVRAPCVTCHVPAVAQVISILIPMPVSLSVSLWLRFPSVFKWH